jgi:hypothetical protein
MILGNTTTASAPASSNGRTRSPLTFNGKEIDKKTGWQTLELQGDLANMAQALYDAEVAFKAKVGEALMAAAGKAFNADKHRVMLTTNYGKWSFTFADKAVRRNTVTIG